MANCETVRIARDNRDGKGDYTIIDKRKFDAETMELWADPSIKKPVKKKVSKKSG